MGEPLTIVLVGAGATATLCGSPARREQRISVVGVVEPNPARLPAAG